MTVISLLDKAINYLVGCVIQKRNWFFRKRPKGAPGGVDAKAFTISGKDARQDSLGYNGKPKDGGLKTKSIAAALERVCIFSILNIFFKKNLHRMNVQCPYL